MAALPFNDRLQSLGSSKAMALKRLASLNRRFQRDKHFETEYRTVLQEYLTLGHMTKVKTKHSNDNGYYLPHHAVIKASS